MASKTPLPDLLAEQVLTWAAESYMPPLMFWRLDGKDEQGWWDRLAKVRFVLELIDPKEWPE